MSFPEAAAYLMSRLERLSAIDADADADAARQATADLLELAFDRGERTFPGSAMRLQTRLADLAAEVGDVTRQNAFPERPYPVEYARDGTVFAMQSSLDEVELRVGENIADAAMRTPHTSASARGDDWVRFAPPTWDKLATDRLEAWFRVAWRFAGAR